MKKNWYIIVVAVLGGVFGLFLQQILYGKPSEIPSVLVNKAVPEFDLPVLGDEHVRFTHPDLKQGKPVLVNVWASWCVPCRAEHPQLVELKNKYKIDIYGLNYKDSTEKAQEFIKKFGNPFVKTGSDESGRTGILWGIFGVPETFVVSGEGIILYKHIGPLTQPDIETKILPYFTERDKNSKIQ